MSALAIELHRQHLERRARFFGAPARRAVPVQEVPPPPPPPPPPLAAGVPRIPADLLQALANPARPVPAPRPSRAKPRRVLLADVRRVAAKFYRLSEDDLIGPSRRRTIARARQTAIYVARRVTERSSHQIGTAFGGRDHTTVLHSVQRIEQTMTTSRAMVDEVEALAALCRRGATGPLL